MNKEYLYCIILSISIFIFNSCTFLPIKKKIIKKYDGIYNVSFVCKDKCKATANIKIKNGNIKGYIQNIENQFFNINGLVEHDGKIILTSIISNSKKSIKGSGKISNDGIIRGTYFVGENKCNFSGFCFTKDSNEIVTKYDGTYQIKFIRDDKIVSQIKTKIIKGAFNAFIPTIFNEIYKVDGKVSKDGNIILNTIFSNMDKGITASGSISNNGILKGEYITNSGLKGIFTGELIQN